MKVLHYYPALPQPAKGCQRAKALQTLKSCGTSHVTPSECQIAKLPPTILRCTLPDLHNYKEERVSLHAESNTSKRYPRNYSKTFFLMCVVTIIQYGFFSSSGLSKTYQNALSSSTASYAEFKDDVFKKKNLKKKNKMPSFWNEFWPKLDPENKRHTVCTGRPNNYLMYIA